MCLTISFLEITIFFKFKNNRHFWFNSHKNNVKLYFKLLDSIREFINNCLFCTNWFVSTLWYSACGEERIILHPLIICRKKVRVVLRRHSYMCRFFPSFGKLICLWGNYIFFNVFNALYMYVLEIRLNSGSQYFLVYGLLGVSEFFHGAFSVSGFFLGTFSVSGFFHSAFNVSEFFHGASSV